MRIFFSFALVALVCAAFTSCGGNSDPGEVALNCYKAMTEGGDFTQYLDPSADKQVLEKTVEESKEGLKSMKEMGVTVSDIKLVGVEENGDKATAKISQTITALGQTETSTVPVPLVKVDGKWYVSAK